MSLFGGLQTTIVAILILNSCFSDGNASKARRKRIDAEGSLMLKLLATYNNLVRPVEKPSDTLTVSFGITLIRILEVSEGPGQITTNVWQKLEWNDWNLRWNPADYGNISIVRIPIHRIWAPDIYLYNSAAESYSPMFDTDAIVRSDGGVTFVSPYIMLTACEFNPGWAEQACSLEFGSWTYNNLQLDLVRNGEDGRNLSRYTPSKHWELLSIRGVQAETESDLTLEPHAIVTYNIKIKRKLESNL